MSKKRAGIFDPWRQDEPEAQPQMPRRLQPPVDPDEGEEQMHCVRFPGRRAGINVWINGDSRPTATLEARAILVACIHEIYNLGSSVSEGFRSRGIQLTSTDSDAIVLTDGGDREVHILGFDREDVNASTKAIEALSFALRSAQNGKSPAAEIMVKWRVKPFVQ